VVSLFLKDFHRESKPWSRLFKTGNNFRMHEWAKKPFFIFEFSLENLVGA